MAEIRTGEIRTGEIRTVEYERQPGHANVERYRNLSGDSGVEAFEIGPDFIAIRFRLGAVYWYTRASVGAAHLDEMKRLASRGKGLSTYISTHTEVSGGYVRKDPDA
jgi:hypothetical protein